MENSIVIAALIALVTLTSCEKKVTAAPELSANNLTPHQIGSDQVNPYEVSNMQAAYNVVSDEFGLPSTSLSPNSAYIEVQLQDEDDEELLADDLSINTFDYPPHRDIVLEGDYSDWNPYNVCDTCVTPKYVTVDLNHSLPSGLVLDTLDMVYFPDEDPSWSSLLSESNIEDFYYRMEEEAYNLAGVDFGEQSSGKTSLLNRWTPNGNIKYYDKEINSPDSVKLEGMRIVVNKGIKSSRAYTDSNGDFTMTKKFSGKVRYKIQFKGDHFVLRNKVGKNQVVSTRKKGSWNKVITEQKDLYPAITYRAVYHYYNFDILNLERPYTSGNRIKIDLKGARSTGPKGTTPINKEGRKILVYTEIDNVEDITRIAFHEMQHTVQGKQPGLLSAIDLYSAESMATGVEVFLTRMYYPDYTHAIANLVTPGTPGVEIKTGGYTGLVRDLVDNDNSPEDYCSGFDLADVEDDFFSSQPGTWNDWRDEIITNRSTNQTVNKVSDLFAAWKS